MAVAFILIVVVIPWTIVLIFMGVPGSERWNDRAGVNQSGSTTPPAKTESASTSVLGQTPVSELQVRKAPDDVTDAINSSIGYGLSIRNAYVARSEAHKKAYFIAGEFVGPGANGQVGVWLKTGEIDGPGMYVSVDGFADEFSDFPYGRETATKATIYDPPARQLQKFVQDQ